jgi:hypothetical protein
VATIAASWLATRLGSGRASSRSTVTRDDAVYWGFSRSSLDRLGRLAGLRRFELVDAPEIACHPPILGTLEKG